LHELNPDEVIPERVRQALDTLAEGLIIVDKNRRIVFSNSEFARKLGLQHKELIGKDSVALDWELDSESSASAALPWLSVLEGGGVVKGVKIRLNTGSQKRYTFSVNASPITAAGDEIRGALITFDNITETEQQNEELSMALGKLESSRQEVMRQNNELRVLATHDPLTGVLNRRALFQGFDTLFAEAREEGEGLCCIMVDIDHFKSVNDRFGHGVGDQVIKFLSEILTKHSRPHDLVGRYGGEEFCIVLPGVDIDIGSAIAERMRLTIQKGEGAKFNNGLCITASFGVSSLCSGATNPQELVDQADKAMYASKESGRNRVSNWSGEVLDGTFDGALISAVTNKVLVSAEQTTLESIKGDVEKLTPEVSATITQAEDLASVYSEQNLWQENKQSADEDTSLANSVVFFDRIDQGINRAKRTNTQIAVLVMYVDTLQRVYDTFGVAVGNKLARIILSRLKQVLRLTDAMALADQEELLFSIRCVENNRIAVVLTDLEQVDIITDILKRIFSTLEEPVEVDGDEFYPSVVVGVSVFPLDGEDAEALIRNASSAMSEAKQSKARNNFRFFANDINQRAKKLIEMEAELNKALKCGELMVYYQPKVDLKTGCIDSLEALIRWQHPVLGVVSPNDFIPLAEHVGLIKEISNWVISTVCRQILIWQEAGYGAVAVAVNISPAEFRSQNRGEQIIAMVKDSGAPISAIELEVTETAIMQSMDAAVNILETLSDAGFKITVDDFGTGYSSLSYLKHFPLSKVKIDRSFITDVMQGSNDAAIVSAIISMSHSLGLRVVAEGVETEEQLRFLQDHHCDEIQGYLISKPVPSEAVSELWANASRVRSLILQGRINCTGVMGHGGAESASGMLGILNDFPVKVRAH
jgi:diguanylate cyclase (GGDEF)-like protein/PAS domain S-box-containing protein